MPLKSSISLNPSDSRHFNNLMKHLQGIDVDLTRTFEANAKETVRKMKSDAPKDTGRLERNIQAQANILLGYDITSVAIDPETLKDYAPEQEYGGRNFPAQPYFWKNLRAFQRKVARDVTSIFRNLTALKRVTR